MVVNFKGGIFIPQGELSVGPTPIPPTGPTLPDLEMHYDAQDSDSLTLSGSDVTQWDDISGNARHQTNSGGTRPTLESGVANGFDCVRFTGNSFVGASWSGGDCTVTMVIKYDATDLASAEFAIATGFVGGLNLGQWNQLSNKTFGINTFAGDAFGSSEGVTVLTADYTVVTAYLESGNITSGFRLFFNETEKVVAQHAGSTNNSVTVGGTFDVGDFGGNAFPMRGDICEVYVNSGLMGDSLRGELITFLKSKWSIS